MANTLPSGVDIKVLSRVYTANEKLKTLQISKFLSIMRWLKAAKLATKLEWMENAMKLVTDPLPATRLDKENQLKTRFNNILLNGTGPMYDSIDNQDTYVELGNGDPVPDVHAIKNGLKRMEQECVAIPWKKGDVMLINNLLVLHGRQPQLKPPRRILAFLCK